MVRRLLLAKMRIELYARIDARGICLVEIDVEFVGLVLDAGHFNVGEIPDRVLQPDVQRQLRGEEVLYPAANGEPVAAQRNVLFFNFGRGATFREGGIYKRYDPATRARERNTGTNVGVDQRVVRLRIVIILQWRL